MKQRYIATVVALLLSTLMVRAQDDRSAPPAKPQTRLLPSVVPLARLIANPEAFDGEDIVTSGYLHSKFENSALYLTKEDADFLSENAVWVSYADKCAFELIAARKRSNLPLQASDFDGRRVEVRGKVNARKHGHMGVYAATLEDVRNVAESVRYYDGDKSVWSERR